MLIHKVEVHLTEVPYEQCDITQRLAWDRLWTWLLGKNYKAQDLPKSYRPQPDARGGHES